MKGRVRLTQPPGEKAGLEPVGTPVLDWGPVEVAPPGERPWRALRVNRPALEKPLPGPFDPTPLLFWGRLFVGLVWGVVWILLLQQR